VIVRTGRRKALNLYLQGGAEPVDGDIEIAFCAHPAVSRLIAVAATVGLAHHPELLRDADVIDGLGHLRELQRDATGCPTSECVHPLFQHAIPLSQLSSEAPHRCASCPGGDEVTGP
jgi:hypothetical protein